MAASKEDTGFAKDIMGGDITRFKFYVTLHRSTGYRFTERDRRKIYQAVSAVAPVVILNRGHIVPGSVAMPGDRLHIGLGATVKNQVDMAVSVGNKVGDNWTMSRLNNSQGDVPSISGE